MRKLVRQQTPTTPPRPVLPPGVTPGVKLPDGLTLYIADRPEPNVVLLYRWYIPEGPTAYDRVGQRTGEFYRGYPLYTNPFGGKWGWTLNAMGKKAEAERELTGPSAADRLRHWFVQLPAEGRVALQPAHLVGPGDPLRAAGSVFRQWVADDCIAALVRAGAQGSPQVAPLLFAVQPRQTLRLGEGKTTTVYPIQDLVRIMQEPSEDCALERPGMTLSEAATLLGFPDKYKPLSVGADGLYDAWRVRARVARGRAQLEVNAAYHRILLHRFLRQKRLTPRVPGRGDLSRAIERRANLLQAYRVFVFDRRGCPVGLNVPLLEANHIGVKSILDKQVTHAGFTALSDRAKKFGGWLFTDVLDKAIVECKPQGIQGLDALLAAAERIG